VKKKWYEELRKKQENKNKI